MTDIIEAMQAAVALAHSREGHGIGRTTCEAIVRAALAEAEKLGWVMVPKEPTHEMLVQMDAYDAGELTARGIWEAGTAAAPKP